MAHEITSRVENCRFFDRPLFTWTGCSVFNFWASICYEMFPTRHLLERTRRALADRRGVNESTSVKARGSRVRRVSSPDSRKAFPRIVEGPNAVKGKSGTQWKREKKRTRVKEAMDFYARARERNRFAWDSYGRLFSGGAIVNERARRFLKRIWLFSSASSTTLSRRVSRSREESISWNLARDRYRFCYYRITLRYKCNYVS